MNRERWAEARNVLCVRLDSLGDVLLTTPAMAALKHARADRRITLLTSASGAEAARLVPEIDEVIVYEAPWMKATSNRDASAADHQMIRRLACRQFDAAAIFTVYSQNPLPAALFCYLADIPLRLAHCRENPYQLLTDWVREPEPQDLVRHEVQRHLDLVASVGVEPADDRLRLRVPPMAQRRVRRLLRTIGLAPSDCWLVIHPGSTAASRRYPPEQFAKVAEKLAKRGWEVIFTGSEAESKLIAAIQAQMFMPSRSLAGRLTLGELAALVEASPVLISNNTGPVHVAAAVGTPVVDLYALTNPQHTPWRVPHRLLFHDVPCKYCYKSVCPEGHHHCLRRVEPQAVVQATLELLQETGRHERRDITGPENQCISPRVPFACGLRGQ
ncbi:MAG TPA: lipopolysaccharide heptosyltransferase II [Pirellulales bacterium]|nr:lipopolysaccharide heptosyltransferase II [Pirellulales bacterium]